ncbi:hypothetical protein [Cupriavidus basilensis]|uniref:Uncharacterized protein n=1 Tax=Cupriavidus basilensis TaxID=68895 RepID=A0A643FJ23_9BURK|nr:hypothetical protein [Cupriavidus basilensis]QOT74855.1 hypothetical protein F7R26_011325 [Cupriavidus basilensis]
MKFGRKAVLLGIAGVIAVVLVSGLATTIAPGAFGQTMAAWLQAIGSIGAILGAVWIATEQRKQAADRDVQMELDDRKTLFDITISFGRAATRSIERLDAYATIEKLPFHVKSKTGVEFLNLERVKDQLGQLPIYRLKDVDAIDDVIEIQRILTDITTRAPGVDGIDFRYLELLNEKTKLENRVGNLRLILQQVQTKSAGGL